MPYITSPNYISETYVYEYTTFAMTRKLKKKHLNTYKHYSKIKLRNIPH